MKPPRSFAWVLAIAVFTAARAADPRAPDPAPPATPAATAPAATAPETAPVVAPPPAVTPAAGTASTTASVLSKLKLPPAVPRSKDAPKPPPLSPRFKQVRERMATLFSVRTETPPAVDATKNPFRVAGAPPPVVINKEGKPEPAPVATDRVLLQQGVAQLKISGFVEREGHVHLTINQALYKEGDVIKVTVKTQTLYLRLSKVTRNSVTLTLNEAEQSLKF